MTQQNDEQQAIYDAENVEQAIRAIEHLEKAARAVCNLQEWDYEARDLYAAHEVMYRSRIERMEELIESLS